MWYRSENYLAGLYLKIPHNTRQYFKLTGFGITLIYSLYFIKSSPYQNYFTQMLQSLVTSLCYVMYDISISYTVMIPVKNRLIYVWTSCKLFVKLEPERHKLSITSVFQSYVRFSRWWILWLQSFVMCRRVDW
jgi:hypothetical protein